MLKRRTSPYLAGRPKGHWFKWKRAALTLDCVLMYAQRGGEISYDRTGRGCSASVDGKAKSGG